MSAIARTLAALAALSILSIAALGVEIHHTGNGFFTFLVWNLFLAWVPVAAALCATALARLGRGLAVAVFGAVWLLFFSNAPYMLTDYIHLAERKYTSAPVWYDALMLSSFVWTALLLGFFSLHLMQQLWRPRFGAVGSWAAVFVSFALSSLGVYLGRFVRFNSWDALVRPRRLGHVIADQLENPLHHPALVAVVSLITLFLTAAYWAVYSFARLDRAPRS